MLSPFSSLARSSCLLIYDSSGIDNVNVYSGDAGVVIPLGPSYPLGPGLSWQLKAYQTSKVWTFKHENKTCTGFGSATLHRALLSGFPTLGVGWVLHMGFVDANKTYVSPDGGRHRGYPNVIDNDGSFVTVDGTNLRINCSGSSCTVEFPDGTIHTFDQAMGSAAPTAGTSSDFYDDNVELPFPRLALKTITNRFSTTALLTVGYLSNGWQIDHITLPLGGNIQFTWGTLTTTVGSPPPPPYSPSVTWPVLTKITFPSAAGLSHDLQVNFDYDQTNPTIPRNFYDDTSNYTDPACYDGNPVQTPFLKTVRLADTAAPSAILGQYGFSYVYNGSGVLYHVGLPTGGTLDYNYSESMTSYHDGFPIDLEDWLVSHPFVRTSVPSASTCHWAPGEYSGVSPAVIQRTVRENSSDPRHRHELRPSRFPPPGSVQSRERRVARHATSHSDGEHRQLRPAYAVHTASLQRVASDL